MKENQTNEEKKDIKNIPKENIDIKEEENNNNKIESPNNENNKDKNDIKDDKDNKNNFLNVVKNEIDKKTNEENNKIETNIDTKAKEKSPTKIFSSVITTGKEKINDIYLKKVNDLSNIYNYTYNYIYFISQIFKKISEPFYSKLSSSYINNVKPYLKYFKELVNILISFSEKLYTLNSSIEDKKEENDDEDLIRVENNLNSAVKKLNVIFADTSSVIAKNLKENIINKPLFAKYETIETKFEDNFHKMLNLISQLEQFRIIQ